MSIFEFTLVLEGEVLSPESLEALYKAGCNDGTFGEVDAVPFGNFSRAAPSAARAIGTAIHDVHRALPEGRVVRVEPDDLVTASEIAQRLRRTRESVRLLISGERGPGGFPAPASHLRSRGRLWRWSDVVRWAESALGWSRPPGDATLLIAAVNHALERSRPLGMLADRLDREGQMLVHRLLRDTRQAPVPRH